MHRPIGCFKTCKEYAEQFERDEDDEEVDPDDIDDGDAAYDLYIDRKLSGEE